MDSELDKQIDAALHPERNGAKMKGITEGASCEHVIKADLKALIFSHQLAIDKAVGEARINELEIMPSSTFNHPYREYVKQRLAALKEVKCVS